MHHGTKWVGLRPRRRPEQSQSPASIMPRSLPLALPIPHVPIKAENHLGRRPAHRNSHTGGHHRRHGQLPLPPTPAHTTAAPGAVGDPHLPSVANDGIYSLHRRIRTPNRHNKVAFPSTLRRSLQLPFPQMLPMRRPSSMRQMDKLSLPWQLPRHVGLRFSATRGPEGTMCGGRLVNGSLGRPRGRLVGVVRRPPAGAGSRTFAKCELFKACAAG